MIGMGLLLGLIFLMASRTLMPASSVTPVRVSSENIRSTTITSRFLLACRDSSASEADDTARTWKSDGIAFDMWLRNWGSSSNHKMFSMDVRFWPWLNSELPAGLNESRAARTKIVPPRTDQGGRSATAACKASPRLPLSLRQRPQERRAAGLICVSRSEEHTSELQSPCNLV